MKLIHHATELNGGPRKVCLAIGVFDGVHLGHQQIIRQTVSDARRHDALAVVATFDRHPSTVVAPAKVPPQIYSHSQKLHAIEALAVDAVLEIRFDEPFSRKTAEVFIGDLAAGFGQIHSICVGADFVFGWRRGGNVSLLKTLGQDLHFEVHGLAEVALDGEVVSSTRIRSAIAAGNFDGASQMLGRPYSICGRVFEGDRIGRQLGFPTANLDVQSLVLPPTGVYSAMAQVDARRYRAALNIGYRPTVASPTPLLRVEAHLLDYDGLLYGRELELEIGAKLRDERRFESRTDLREQIARDIAAVRALD
jgi:riboflavin kinase/FMN adenylyltransferase